jgi:hypothetical protein
MEKSCIYSNFLEEPVAGIELGIAFLICGNNV